MQIENDVISARLCHDKAREHLRILPPRDKHTYVNAKLTLNGGCCLPNDYSQLSSLNDVHCFDLTSMGLCK